MGNQPSTTGFCQSGWSDSNRRFRVPGTRGIAATYIPLFPVGTAGFGPVFSWYLATLDATPLRVLPPTVRGAIAVGREALESSSPVLQTGVDHPSGGARVSATNPNKKPDVACGTGFSCMFRYFGGRVSQTPVAQGERIRRLTGEIPLAFLFVNATRPQSHHLWHLLLKATTPSLRLLSVTTELDATVSQKVRGNFPPLSNG